MLGMRPDFRVRGHADVGAAMKAWFDSDTTETLSTEWFTTVVTYHPYVWAAMGGEIW